MNDPRARSAARSTAPRRETAATASSPIMSGLSLAEELSAQQRGAIVAVVGGGGKTSLVFALAKECRTLGLKALISTTTKMMEPSTPQDCDVCVVVESLQAAVQQVCEAFADGAERTVVLASGFAAGHSTAGGGAAGGTAERRRIDGVPPDWPQQLIAASACDVVIVEADGARKLPFKAPAENEPVLPVGTTTVVAVGGIDALGVPIAEDFVCRAHVVAQVSELPLGSELTATAMGSVLGSRTVWRVPESVQHFVVCVNKADTAPLQAAGASVAREAVDLGAGCEFALITGEAQVQGGRRRGTIFAKVLPTCDESNLGGEVGPA